VAVTQASVNLSDFNNVLIMAVGDVEWIDVLNKPEFFTGSYNDLTHKPSIEEITGHEGPQGPERPYGIQGPEGGPPGPQGLDGP
jgi:hypothetical protein